MADADDRQFSVLLFVIGDDEGATSQADALKSLLFENEHSQNVLRVIDLSRTPEDALTYDILAIPTIIREQPKPAVRIVGDLSDKNRVWSLLTR
ncbi:circadian clock KaiB family protein [Aestuariibius sp. 2305UL40-4]|uniref:circadian clock KaiB family protein n=1 Tax=Aestuariibius violaceus TaxID=3234132 RepID=UPI00345EAD06